MWEKFYQGVNDPGQMEAIIRRLLTKETGLAARLEKIQDSLQDTYSEALRAQYLSVQTELMLLREQIEKAQTRLKSLKRLQK